MKKFKNVLSFIFVFMVAFSCFALVGCKNGDGGDGNKTELGDGKVLVTYFSATGHTSSVAGYVKNILDADIYEIVPINAYTSADLNYNNSSSRVSLEHSAYVSNNRESEYFRPEFNKTLGNLNDYDIIFIGYPIWWGQAPNIVYSFLEEYGEKFAGKTIVPFCTSASSPIGTSATNLHSYASKDAVWLSGKRFSSSASRSDVQNWIDDILV